MIDYVFGDITGIIAKEFSKNKLLEFKTLLNEKTGELENKKSAIYNHCKFINANDKYINFAGSLHKYFFNGINYNDFTIYNLIEVIKDLHIKFNANPFLNVLHNVEFGVNVILPFSTKVFLNSIIAFKGKEYEMRDYKGRGYMIKFRFKHWYELKIYDKGFQYQLPENILRFEIKVTTMNFLRAKEIEIRTFRDLLNPEIHKQLGKLLIDFFKQLIIYDHSIDFSKVNKREKELLKSGGNPKYWKLLKETNREVFKKRVKRFRELVYKNSKLKTQETVCELIKSKWESLIKIDNKTFQNLENYLGKIKPETFPEITDLPKTIFPQNNTSNSMLLSGKFINVGRRYCKTCKRDITNQKKGSVFCSEKLYGKEVKKCRNKNSNPRNNYRRKEQRIYGGGFLLFDINQLKQTIANF